MAAVPKLSQEGRRLANATAMDYCSRNSRYKRESPSILFRGASLCGAPRTLTMGLAFGIAAFIRDM